MKIQRDFIFLTFFLSLFLSFQIFAQTTSSEDSDFDQALQKYVNENLLRFGENEIARERFLVQQMRDINDEIKSRVTNVKVVRDQYFVGLLNRLEELEALRARLSDYNSASLNSFIDKLESRIRKTLDNGEVNYRSQKVLEDGIQVLYIAEEMMKLDPGARLESNPQLSQRLQSSNQRLLDSFGEAGSPGSTASYAGSGGKSTIWDLFVEWKRTNSIQYEVRWTDIQIIKNKLLKNGTALHKDRMFKRELGSASMAYNFRNYDLADRMYEEILARYAFVTQVDDIHFYRGEANFQIDRFEMASLSYDGLIKNFPASPYLYKAYARLIVIANHFGDHQKVSNYFKSFEPLAQSNDPLTDETRFTAGLSAVNGGAFEEAVNILNMILPGSPYYIDARYLLSRAYVGVLNLEEAENVLLGIVNNYNTMPDYHFNVYLKLAMIRYEMGDFSAAITYLNKIGGEFSLYDRVVMAYSWSYYKLELAKVEKERDFTISRKYLAILLNNFSNSDYYLEGRSLLAYIYQLEKNARKAIDNYEYVYQASHTRKSSDENLRMRDNLRNQLLLAETEKDRALQVNDRIAYIRAQDQYIQLQDSLLVAKNVDFSPNSGAFQNEIQRIQNQIKQLDELRIAAVERNSPDVIERIDNLRENLTNELADATAASEYSFLGINPYDEHPLARKESVSEDKNKKILEMRMEAQRQKRELSAVVADIDKKMERAKRAKNYKQMVYLDIERDRYKSLLKKYDFMATIAFEMEASETDIQLQKWSNYGAFGIANVNFSVRQDNKNKVAYYSQQIDTINRILNNRKSLLDYKIAQVEGEINFMTRKVRRQERLRERAELDRKFEESYFDTHTSEIQESETTPPNFNEPDQEDKGLEQN